MFLVALGCEEFGLVENTQEFRNLSNEIEEGAKPFNLLPRRMCGAGSRADELHHVDADFRQQLIQEFLTIFEVIVEGTLCDARLLGDAGDGRFGISIFADYLGRGIEYLLLCPSVALDSVQLGYLRSHGRLRRRHFIVSNSARSTRLRILPEGFLGRLLRIISSFGTLKPARCARQWAASAVRSSVVLSTSTTTATGFSPQRSSGMPMTATSRTCGSS